MYVPAHTCFAQVCVRHVALHQKATTRFDDLEPNKCYTRCPTGYKTNLSAPLCEVLLFEKSWIQFASEWRSFRERACRTQPCDLTSFFLCGSRHDRRSTSWPGKVSSQVLHCQSVNCYFMGFWARRPLQESVSCKLLGQACVSVCLNDMYLEIGPRQKVLILFVNWISNLGFKIKVPKMHPHSKRKSLESNSDFQI